MTAPIFYGHVDGNRVVPAEQRRFQDYVATLRGKPVEIIVRPKRSRRSLDQNAWLWGPAYGTLCDHLGYDYDERETVHYALVERWGGTHYDEKLKANVPNKRSSKLTTAEFSEYMEWLVRFASKEFGCVIPLPDEVDEVTR